jgi:hypothetical protein
MPILPYDTKYRVANAIEHILNIENVGSALQDEDIDFFEFEIYRVSRLVFQIRIKPNGGGIDKRITLRISEGT